MPEFLIGCCMGLPNSSANSKLQNVHVGLAPSRISGASVHVVKGSYVYYHYLHDGFDDKGWGCAYRSLQTLWSWFFVNKFTYKPPPSHREIQQTLVDIGDKKEYFIDSKQWIGSTEVGLCLDRHLGISSKFIFVASGNQLAQQGEGHRTAF